MEAVKHPIDLLPIPKPLDDKTVYNSLFFYEQVVKPLVPDIIQLEATGIPINLDKVSELDKTVTDVLDKVHEKLANNEVMLEFLRYQAKGKKESKTKELESKKKIWEDFLVEFNVENATHRSYAVNFYLTTYDKKDMCMDKWSIKSLKKLNQILASNFIQDILDKNISPYSTQHYIVPAMELMAKDKAELYNKNRVNFKIEALDEVNFIKSFNPGSPKQKAEFFAFYGIESEKETEKGSPQFNRDELERIQQLLKELIDESKST